MSDSLKGSINDENVFDDPLDQIKNKLCLKCSEQRRFILTPDLEVCNRCKPIALKKLKYKIHQIKLTYRLEYDEYLDLYVQQRKCCAICKKTPQTLGRDLVVDHCHTTGRVRGLLCNHCNRLLGFAQDDMNTLEGALEYLKHF